MIEWLGWLERRRPWASLTAAEKKAFNPFLLLRLIGNHPIWVQWAARVQGLRLSPEGVYRLALAELPRRFTGFQFPTKSPDPWHPQLVSLLGRHWQESPGVIRDWLAKLSPDYLRGELRAMGVDDTTIETYLLWPTKPKNTSTTPPTTTKGSSQKRSS